MSNAFDLDSDGSSDDTDAGDEFQSIGFVKELIVPQSGFYHTTLHSCKLAF
jgi:hypothetical protein